MKTTQGTQKLLSQNFINIVPVVCALMVVLLHTYIAPDAQTDPVSAFVIGFFSHGLCTAAVPIFFFLSGYLFYSNVEQISDVFQKQKKRVFSVLIPFLAWSTFYYLFYAIGTNVMSGIATQVDTTLAGVLRGIVFYEHCFLLWYMFQLCIYVLLAPLLFYILKNRYVSAIILIVAAAVGMFFKASIEISFGSMERALFHFNFFAYYLLGCILARRSTATNKLKEFVKHTPVAVLAVAFVVFGLAESLLFEGVMPSFNERCLVPFVFIAFLLLMMKICDTERVLSKTNVSTMIIYGVHPLCGVIFDRLVMSRLALPDVVHYVLSFACVAALSWTVGLVMKQIKPIYAVFSGNR